MKHAHVKTRSMAKPPAKLRPPKQERGNSAFYRKLDRALKWIDQDPGAAARHLQIMIDRAEETARISIYIAAIAAYSLAERLYDDAGAWESFNEEAFWKDHCVLNREEVLRYALMFVYGDHQGQKAERARDHARAMQSAWDQKIPARRVFENLMKNGGFNALKKKPLEPDAEKTKRLSLIVDQDNLAHIMKLGHGDMIRLEVVCAREGSRQSLTIKRAQPRRP